MELLPLIGHSRWQGRDVPVYVCVALMAAQRHEINPLGRERHLQRLGYIMDYADHSPEQVVIPSHIDDVGARRNDRVPAQRWISAEECHDVVIAVHRLMFVVWMSAQIVISSLPFHHCGESRQQSKPQP